MFFFVSQEIERKMKIIHIEYYFKNISFILCVRIWTSGCEGTLDNTFSSYYSNYEISSCLQEAKFDNIFFKL